MPERRFYYCYCIIRRVLVRRHKNGPLVTRTAVRRPVVVSVFATVFIAVVVAAGVVIVAIVVLVAAFVVVVLVLSLIYISRCR